MTKKRNLIIDIILGALVTAVLIAFAWGVSYVMSQSVHHGDPL